MTQTELVREKIKGTIQSNRVVLFMKGTQTAPRCGFSAQVCSILGDLGVSFESFDVLGDATLREEIKAFSNWPILGQGIRLSPLNLARNSSNLPVGHMQLGQTLVE